MSKIIRTYFWDKKPNFGDGLAPLLLNRFCRVSAEWSDPEDADIVIIGSIMEKLPPDYGGIVCGIGKLHEGSKPSLNNAIVLALRGPLSAKGVRGVFALGDPALLADELVGQVDKEYNLGLVPHWTDAHLEKNPIFQKFHPKIIRVEDDPLTVIREIGQCKKIVSSSLHGLIVADAFGIPRRTEISPFAISNPHFEGGVFKFKDYSAAVGLPFEIGLTQQADHNRVVEMQHEIYDALAEARKLLAAG